MKIPLKYSAICGMRCVNLHEDTIKILGNLWYEMVNLHEDTIKILGNLWYEMCKPT